MRAVCAAFIASALALGCGGDDAPPAARDAAAPAIDAQWPRSDAGVSAPADWTAIVLPDTQILAASHPEIFHAQTRWIVEQRHALNIQIVLHVGDVTDDNGEMQWDVASDALARLDGEVPYVLAPGNHDLGIGGSASDRSTMLNTYFPLSRFAVMPTYGGAFEAGRAENTYHLLESPTGPWLVVALEFGPRDAVVDWAGEVVRAHAGVPAIVITHAYLYSDDTRYDWARFGPAQSWSPYTYGVASDPGGVNDGEELFQAFIRESDDVQLVLSGHVLNDGLGQLTSEQDGGGRVHQLLANYQFEALGGGGFLRIMTFSAAGDRVDVRTYSPYLDEERRDPDNEFVLTLE